MIELQCITKTYSQKPVFSNLSYSFGQNTYALQGANGSGKTTLLSMIAGALEVDRGEIIINGINLMRSPVAAKKQMSFIPDHPEFYPFLTGKDFISFLAEIKKISDRSLVEQFIRQFEVEAYLDIPLSNMSLGTVKKFFMIPAFAADTSIIIMDEPTNSLDIQARKVLCNYVKENDKNKTFIFSTHNQEFIEETHAIALPLKQLIESI